MRPKSILSFLAILVILALVARQISQAVKHTFGPRPGVAQLDKSTPAAQSGFTLLEIDPISSGSSYEYTDKGPQANGTSSETVEDETGLWIKLPDSYTLPQNCDQSDYIPCAGAPAITARDFRGYVSPLIWRSSSISDSNRSRTYLLASIPSGYPNSVRWMDVTIDDHRGDTARWHITHLPPMQHVLAPPVILQTTIRQGGIQATADAYTARQDNGNGTGHPQILFDLHGTITGAAHQWELGHLKLWREWEAPGYVPADSGMTMGSGKVNTKVTFEIEQQPVYWNQSSPYLADTHFVRLNAALQEFDTYDETVTFHHLSVVKIKNGNLYLADSIPQTVTTPDGVTVTLDDVQHRQNFIGEWSSNGGYSLHLLYPQTTKFPMLPRSPLWRKYRRMVKVSADIPKPYEARGSSYGDTEGTYHFDTTRPLSKTILNFPVIIHQRVDLRSVPMTFTLPVADKAPRPQ